LFYLSLLFPFLFAASTTNIGVGLVFEPDIEELHWLVSLIPGQGRSRPRDRDTDREKVCGSVCMKGIFDQAVVVFDELASTKKKKKKKRTRGAFLFFFLTFK